MEGTRATEVLIILSITEILLGSSRNSPLRGLNAVSCQVFSRLFGKRCKFDKFHTLLNYIWIYLFN